MKLIQHNLIVFFLIEIFAFISNDSIAQNSNDYTINGVVIDSISHQAVSFASLAIVNQTDHKIIKSTTSNETGNFKFKSLSAGKFNLVISCISYGKTTKEINIKGAEKNIDIGKIKLSRQSILLQDVVIEGLSIPVMIKGDTIEFNTVFFKTDTNAMIEALIKKLPGVEIDNEGNIKAQGKEVMKIYVDGKPFFGDDPKMATRNLPVDMFEKIQLIDKKSDQAIFTQVDDGETEKIMNLITKRGKKDGLFGKFSFGAGNEERYDGSANLNWFKNARQLSIIGNINNINNIRFNDFASLDQTSKSDKNSLNKNSTSSSGIYSANSNGINKSGSVGINFRDSIGSKISFAGSYLYSESENKKDLYSSRQTFLTDSVYITNNHQKSTTNPRNHTINLQFEYTLDSMNSILLNPHFKINNTNSDQINSYISNGQNTNLFNTSDSKKTREKQTLNADIELLLRHKFKKPRRTLSLLLKVANNPATNEGNNLSYSSYYKANILKYDTVDHYKDNTKEEINVEAKMSYTEPIAYNKVMEINYQFKQKKNISDRKTFDFNTITNEYDIPHLSLNNNYENTFQNHKVGINLKVFKYKWDYTIGAGIEPSSLISKLVDKDSTITRNLVKFSPQFILNLVPRKGKKLTLKYKGNTIQPNLDQLQPVIDNSNPLYIYIGNAGLQPEFANTLTISYNSTNLSNFNYFFSNIVVENVMDQISNSISYDSSGVQTTMPVNVNGNYSLNLNAGIGRPIRKFFLNFGCNTGFINDINFLDQQRFSTKVLSLGVNSRINYNGDNLSFSPIVKVLFNKAWYDLNNRPDAQYLNYILGFEFQANIFWNIKIGSDIQYINNTTYGMDYNLDMTIWNAFISQQIFASKKGSIKFQVYDILKQNKSMFRNTSDNYVEDIRVNNLSQFFMLSFSYSFGKFQTKQLKSKSSGSKKNKNKK
ncbi:MAG: TonB-dependent receptor [Bacteroidales bacterium]